MILALILTLGALGHAVAGAPFAAPQAAVRIPAEERAALIALFQATNGAHWSSSGGWTRDDGTPDAWGTECEWEGVECDDDDAHVVGIGLTENNLSGTLPAELFNLKYLTKLNLSRNALSGRIPLGLLSLPKIEEVNLSGNGLSGGLALGPTCRLESLYLSDNNLTGTVPSSLGRCDRMRYIDLSGNAFSSSLPPGLGRLDKLEALALASNALNGALPWSWRGLAALQTLDLARNNLTGSLAVLGSLKTLASVDVSHNQFQGELGALASLPDLRSLNASHNRLTGQVPAGLGDLDLWTLDLSRNVLTGRLPRSFASLEKLRSLNLAFNQLSGPLPQFKGMDSLRSLALASNTFEGDVRRLELPDSLEEVDFSNNRLGGTLSDGFFEGELRRVDISNNRIVGPLPAALWNSATLELLRAQRNQISGRFPDEIEDLSELRRLDLSRNALVGPIPESLLSLPSLMTVDLSGNQLSGELPSNGGRAIQRIDLSDNRIRGAVPAWVGKLPALRFVGLAGNLLTDGVETLANSRSLRAASLEGNPWRSSIPPKLAALKTVLDPHFPFLDAEVLNPPPPPPPPPPPLPSPPDKAGSVGSAAISGRVLDQTGAVIPGATITVASESTQRGAVTDESGMFRIPVPPGSYQLTGELAGFSTVAREVTASVGQTSSVDLVFSFGGKTELVTVAAERSEQERGPWWNTWTTRRGAGESNVRPTLAPNSTYTFYLELSAVRRALAGAGVRSSAVDPTFIERLKQLATDDEEGPSGPVVMDHLLEPPLTFRFLVVGRAASRIQSPNNLEVWQDGLWAAANGSSSATVTVQFAALLRGGDSDPQDLVDLSSRASAVRLGIQTAQPGCAAVAVSVWDETGRLPMDSAVYYLPVGGPAMCDNASAMKRASINLLKGPDERDVAADAALHNFEFAMNDGASASASFMVLRTAEVACDSYSWSSDATVSGLVLNNSGFKQQLKDARLPEGSYATVAELMRHAVFPPARDRCGSDAAWAALRRTANAGRTRIFARFTDRLGQLQTVPLALLAMAAHEGTALFPYDLTVIEPLPRETLDATSCVSAWTFVLPTTLHGLGTVAIPPWAATDERVLHSRTDFQEKFLAASDTTDPQGLLVLAHHEQGVLTFTGAKDILPFSAISRRIGDGSIAVLSACETSSLDDNARLIARLNDRGVDALVTSPFVVDPTFGAVFAAHFATVVHELELETDLEDVFREAVRRTSDELKHSRDDVRARGMGLELVLVGNPKLRICPRR